MKKILIPVFGALLAVGACTHSKPLTLGDARNFQDSITVCFADYLGHMGSYEAARSKHKDIDKAQMLVGFHQVFDTDTSNISRLYGVQSGLTAYDYYRKFLLHGMMDHDMFLQRFEETFLEDSLTVKEIQVLINSLDSLMNTMQAAVEASQPLSAGFRDSIVTTYGEYLGRTGSYQFAAYGIEVDKPQVVDGFKMVIDIDTANISQYYGVRSGVNVFQYYTDLASRETIDKETFVKVFEKAFMADTIPATQLREQKLQVDSLMDISFLSEQKRLEAEAYDSKAAKENRMLAEAVAEKLMSNPDFRPIGSDGLMKRVITPGNGNIFGPDDVVTIDYTLSRIDSRIEMKKRTGLQMLASRPREQMLEAVLPYLSPGETAEFFVPYELAYGVLGNDYAGVGPCESVMLTITVK